MASNNVKIKKGYVLLFKTPKDDYIKDPYVEELEEEGFSADCASALGFKFINQDQLWETLQKFKDYDGLILTSQRSVQAIQKVIDAHKEEGQKVLAEWKKLRSYVVGLSTGEATEKLGLIPIGEETGSAEKLAEFIVAEVKEKEEKKPLVFPCVSIAVEKIPVKLEAEGIPFEALTVYETEASQDISKNLELLLKEQGIPEYIVYFSPSGIQFTVEDLKAVGYPLDSIKFVALGRSTGRRVEQAGLNLAGVAKNPTVSSLISTIKDLRDKSKGKDKS